MPDSVIIDKANTIQVFLGNPLIRKNFDPFFQICLGECISYLRCLGARGYRLPEKLTDSKNPLGELALDLLGELFVSKPNRPFYVIFEFYNRHRITDFDNADPQVLHDMFLMLLKGYIRKGLTALIGQNDPQIANLKRRFKDILLDSRYASKFLESENAEIIFLSDNASNHRLDAQPVQYQDLLLIVEEAFLNSKNRQEWRAEIFRNINKSGDLQNFVKRSDLLRAVIAIKAKYSEIESLNLGKAVSPDLAFIETAIENARAVTLNNLRTDTLDHFIKKGRITEKEASLLVDAAEKYLTDFGYDGSADSIPDYFRESMPESYHKDYLPRYKYIFESVISRAVENFKEILKNDSTIRHLGHYYRSEKD